MPEKAGNFYGTTLYGGTFNFGTVFEVTATGAESVLYSFKGPPADDGQEPHAGVVLDKVGNLYGTTSGGGSFGYGTIFELSPNGIETVLHTFTNTTTDGGTPESGVIRDSAGNLYGATYYGGTSGCGAVFEYAP